MNTAKHAARGLADIQAYLYREAHLGAARRRVSAFTERTAGLTHRQKRDLEEWYLEEQRYVARMVTEHIADSVSAAEAAHHRRFGHWVRGTLLAMAVISLMTFVWTVAVVASMS